MSNGSSKVLNQNRLSTLTTSETSRCMKVTYLRIARDKMISSFEKSRLHCSTSKKIISIRNFRGQPTYENRYVEDEIGKLSTRLNAVLYEENPDLSLEELYRSIENVMAKLDHRETVFSNLNSAIKAFLVKKLDELLDSSCNFLDCLISLYTYYNKRVVILKNLYLPFDRSHDNDFKFNSVQNMCMDLFRNIIILNTTVSSTVTNQLLQVICNDRSKIIPIDRKTVKTVVSMLIDLSVYEIILEKQFLIESDRHFQNEGRNISENLMDVKTYLQHVIKLIDDENSRDYILTQSVAKVLSILYREMIETHAQEILFKGFHQLMNDNSLEALGLMYRLFSKVSNGVTFIAEYFQKYVHDVCFAIVNEAVDKTVMQELIQIKDRLDNVIHYCFEKNPIFEDIMKTNFKKMINTKKSQAAMYLAKFLDSKFRSKSVTEEELGATLDKAMVIFRYVQGKDIFEAFYRKDLAKRLIFGTSTNQDMEQSIIVKLKEECGEGFTSKIEGMLTDIHLSGAINSHFKAFLANTQPSLLEKCDVSISVLTSSFWTKSTTSQAVVLPDVLLNYQAVFSKYYVAIHTGRKLDWQPNLGHCIVRATFRNSVKELEVSLFQIIVLLPFNEYNTMTFGEIQEITKLERKDLIATLHSLSCGRMKILTKQTRGNTIALDDVFHFNAEFTEKLFRIKINQAQLKESVDELKATEQTVLEDREIRMDAAIVRILKSRRTVCHNELITELFKVLDLPIRPHDLKKRIELLIDREYIMRDVDNAAMYTYIA